MTGRRKQRLPVCLRAKMGNPNEKRPDELTLDLNRRLLQIKWMDGHVSQYGFDYLRHHCPCAQCRPWTQTNTMPGDTPERILNASGDIASAQDVRFVGAYSLNIRFADGHADGIYTWHHLRDICPCDEHAGRAAS